MAGFRNRNNGGTRTCNINHDRNRCCDCHWHCCYHSLLIAACLWACLLSSASAFVLPAMIASVSVSVSIRSHQPNVNSLVFSPTGTRAPQLFLSLANKEMNEFENNYSDASTNRNSTGTDDNMYTDDTTDDTSSTGTTTDNDSIPMEGDEESEEVDICIIGAGLGGLCAGAILNTLYGKTVAVYESHYLAGGCAHAFTRLVRTQTRTGNSDNNSDNNLEFTFDSGPTILLGCSSPPFNALQQVLQAVGQDVNVKWIPYTAWGMIENPGQSQKDEHEHEHEHEKKWRLELGENKFQQGPLERFGGPEAVTEFEALREATKDLTAGAKIPAMAMRSGPAALIPLIRYLPTLWSLIQQGETLTGTFAPFMDGPLFTVTNPWLRNWLDALAFSLSGLPASRTSAAAMAFVMQDMHRSGAALDYPEGGMGAIVDALVAGVEQGDNGSKVHLSQHVASIDIDCGSNYKRVAGITLANGKVIRARDGVICNAPVWSLKNLIKDERMLQILNGGSGNTAARTPTPPLSWQVTDEGSSIRQAVRPSPPANIPNPNNKDPTPQDSNLLYKCDTAEMTGSFLHLHLAINATGLNLDEMEAHYTVMDRSLAGDGTVTNGVPDGPCGELNMIALSNPCVIDKTLAPAGYMVIHAYGAGNEPFAVWDGLDRRSEEYKRLKEERAEVLWRAVESVIPDVRDRVVLKMIGSPITHERFLRRPKGTYGSATEDYLKDGTTPFANLVLAGDGCFPGIGVPAVAISGASAANALVGVLEQWRCLDKLKSKPDLKQ